MPIQAYPKYKAVPDKMLDIARPAVRGLNMKDLEFEQEVEQTPYMLNIMYRNGSFSKRYGQAKMPNQFEDEIYATVAYGGDIFVHSGDKIYKYGEEQHEELGTVGSQKGMFIIYAQTLYYMNSNGFYEYKDIEEGGTTRKGFGTIDAYVPDVMINCYYDGTYENDSGTPQDDFNVISDHFSFVYNGTAGQVNYIADTYDNQNYIDWDPTKIKVKVLEEEWVYDSTGTQDKSWKLYEADGHKGVTFKPAPDEGDMNIVLTFTAKPDVFARAREQIYSCQFYECYGGKGNSRLFIAGCGNSRYFFSEAYDVSYFPSKNWARVGNTEDDITGFGRQYNVLILFKPKEIHSISSYIHTTATTIVEEEVGLEGFRSQLVNARIGCDAPYSIQLINNLLTWFSSTEGVCTLVSTNIQDERNVRTLSRNIERKNVYDRAMGILDIEEDPMNVQSADYNNRYFLVFPTSGTCFMWDYEISPYRFTNTGVETNPRDLSWFLFDNFYVKQFLKYGKKLLYASSHKDFNKYLIELNDTFRDLNFDGKVDEEGRLLEFVGIRSYYMTPFIQFGSVEMLKNVKNIYVQCRGDTATVINMYYYTEESVEPRSETETIKLGGKLWKLFKWTNFEWFSINWANTFRRKCNLKKIQMASFYFENDEDGRDMSITHIGLQYQLVKYVR